MSDLFLNAGGDSEEAPFSHYLILNISNVYLLLPHKNWFGKDENIFIYTLEVRKYKSHDRTM
jgi:hypothetical protein